MQGKRIDRVGHLVQMELSRIVLYKMKDPRVGFVTITHVDMTADLKSAYVFYSVLGEEKQKQESRTAFEKAKGFLQKELATSLKLRYTPKLIFREDPSIECGLEIDRVLKNIHHEEEEGGKS